MLLLCLYTCLFLLIPALSLRFFISCMSDEKYVFNKDVDSAISFLCGFVGILVIISLTMLFLMSKSFMCLPLVLLILTVLSINIIIARYYMPKIIYIFSIEDFGEGAGFCYTVSLIFMIYSAFLLPVAYTIASLVKQVTTNNYFYKLYVEQNKGNEE